MAAELHGPKCYSFMIRVDVQHGYALFEFGQKRKEKRKKGNKKELRFQFSQRGRGRLRTFEGQGAENNRKGTSVQKGHMFFSTSGHPTGLSCFIYHTSFFPFCRRGYRTFKQSSQQHEKMHVSQFAIVTLVHSVVHCGDDFLSAVSRLHEVLNTLEYCI